MNKRICLAITTISITIILACFIQAFPKYRLMQKYSNSNAMSSTTGEVTSVESDYTSHRSGSTNDEDQVAADNYQSSEEYENINNRIEAIRERENLLKNNITSDLTDITKRVFNLITGLSNNSDDDTIDECKQFMSDSFYSRFKEMSFDSDSYIVQDIKFSDLDKKDITACVTTRGEKRIFVTYSFQKDKNFVISNILPPEGE